MTTWLSLPQVRPLNMCADIYTAGVGHSLESVSISNNMY